MRYELLVWPSRHHSLRIRIWYKFHLMDMSGPDKLHQQNSKSNMHNHQCYIGAIWVLKGIMEKNGQSLISIEPTSCEVSRVAVGLISGFRV